MFKNETRLVDLRLNKDLKQKDIGKVLKISEDRYSKYERNIDDMKLEICNNLANYYNVSIDYLLGISDKNIKSKSLKINYKILCQRLFELRKENKLTQATLGKKIGFTQTAYYNYESGKSIPRTFKLYYIAQFYNVSFDYLVGRSDIREINI